MMFFGRFAKGAGPVLFSVLLFAYACAPGTAIVTTTELTTSTTLSTFTITDTVTLADAYDLSYLIKMDPADVDNSTLPVTPLERMHVIGGPRLLDIDSYRFTVEGLVGNPMSLSYEEFKALPSEDRVVLLICPYTFADNPLWTGVPLSKLLAAAGSKPEATEVILKSLDGFESPLPISLAPDILLAFEVDGEPLPPEHGYPLRAVVKGRIGLYWLRWLKGVELK